MKDGVNHIKDIREMRNLTQQELADKIGVGVRSIRRWENGEASPDVYNALRISAVLMVNFEDIFEI